MPSSHLILCCPLLLLSSIFNSIRVFSDESTPHQWPKHWNFSFSISPSDEYSGLISFRIDWLDLLAVHGSLRNLLQHHNSKASILWCSAFLMVQVLHPYMTTGKTIARQTFDTKVMSLLFNTLSRFFIAFLPRSKHLSTSWMWSPSAVILEPRKIQPATVYIDLVKGVNVGVALKGLAELGELPGRRRLEMEGRSRAWRQAWGAVLSEQVTTDVLSSGAEPSQNSIHDTGLRTSYFFVFITHINLSEPWDWLEFADSSSVLMLLLSPRLVHCLCHASTVAQASMAQVWVAPLGTAAAPPAGPAPPPPPTLQPDLSP